MVAEGGFVAADGEPVVVVVVGEDDEGVNDEERLNPASSSVRLLKRKMEAMVVTKGSKTVPLKAMLTITNPLFRTNQKTLNFRSIIKKNLKN